MSCGGYGFCQYEVLQERGLKLQPSVILLGLTIGNDFADTYCFAYQTKANCPGKRYNIDDAERLAVFHEADRGAPFSDSARDLHESEQESGLLRRYVSSHSSLYAVARELRSRIASKEYFSPLREDEPPQDAFELCSRRPGRIAYDDQPELRTVFLDPAMLMRRLVASDPRVQEGRRISEALLLSMRAKAEENKARFLVVLIPTKHMVYRDLMERSNQESRDSFSRFVETEKALTESIEQFLRDNQIAFVNSTSALRDCLLRRERPYPESDDQHLNKIGYAKIAEAIAPSVSELLK